MASFSDLIDEFVARRLVATLNKQKSTTGAGYRVAGHRLFHDADGEAQILAGWEHPGTVDATIWIDRHWTGSGRATLEQTIKQIPMVMMNVEPTDDYDDRGADVFWWGYAVECMSCGNDINDNQRVIGLCDACLELRRGPDDLLGDFDAGGGYQQRKGLHGSPLPRKRPTGG